MESSRSDVDYDKFTFKKQTSPRQLAQCLSRQKVIYELGNENEYDLQDKIEFKKKRFANLKAEAGKLLFS